MLELYPDCCIPIAASLERIPGVPVDQDSADDEDSADDDDAVSKIAAKSRSRPMDDWRRIVSSSAGSSVSVSSLSKIRP